MQAERDQSEERPVAAIFRSPVFNASETFVRLHATGLERYRPLMVGLESKGNVPADLEGRILLAAGQREALRIRAFGHWGQLGREIASRKPAILHAHFGPDGWIALPLTRALGIPLVTTLHGYDVTRSRANLFASGRLSWMRYALSELKLARGGDLFLPVSDALRRQALARGFPPDRTFTHYLGIDIGRFQPVREPARQPTILHVGRLVEKKGTAVLLKAMPGILLRYPSARLVICGDGPLRPALEALAGELSISSAVEFRGAVTSDEVLRQFGQSSLLAVPSVTARNGDAEGLPTVLMEAAASGVPIVGTSHSGIPEAVVDGESGFLVPEHDVHALEDRIGKLLEAAETGSRMGMAGRKLAEERFDAARQIRLLEQRYDDVREEYAQRLRSNTAATR